MQTVNQANQNDWPEGPWKKYPIKVTQTAMRVQLRDSPSESAYVSVHMYCTLFPLINTSLLSVFVEILFYKAKGPGPLSLTTDLMARIWCFTAAVQPQSLAGSPSSAPSRCRLRPPEIRIYEGRATGSSRADR